MRISGVLMRASTIPVAITLTLAPLPALPFDQDEFCVAVTDIAHRMNARKGRWLDRSKLGQTMRTISGHRPCACYRCHRRAKEMVRSDRTPCAQTLQ